MLSDLQSQDMNEFKRLRMYYFLGGNSRFSCLVKVVFLLDRIASSMVNDLNGSRNISAGDLILS